MLRTLLALCAVYTSLLANSEAEERSWDCEVFPPEHRIETDPTSGAKIVFVTTSTASDRNLYFHEASWPADGSFFLFNSDRTGRNELFAYLESTGEIVRLGNPEDPPGSNETAGRRSNHVYVIRDKVVHEWSLDIRPGSSEADGTTKVRVRERPVGPLPEDAVRPRGMNDNSDGSALVVGFDSDGPTRSRIVSIDKKTGAFTELAAVDFNIGHIQASPSRPDLAMFCRNYRGGDRAGAIEPGEIRARIWVADSTDAEPRPLYPQLPGELATHECWWVDDQAVFCTGIEAEDGTLESHVKVIDVHTGVARIVGAGSWWPGGTTEEVLKRNWWHCSGALNGKWVAADNWLGDIAVFSSKTSRTRILTENHRTYGEGIHPHVGWDPTGSKVVFGSNRDGNPDVCIGHIPESWFEDWEAGRF